MRFKLWIMFKYFLEEKKEKYEDYENYDNYAG